MNTCVRTYVRTDTFFNIHVGRFKAMCSDYDNSSE